MKQEIMRIVSQDELAPRIFKMKVTGKLVQEMRTPGQFLHIKIPRNDLLLRRPISLAEINHENQTCTIIYRVEGSGTKELSVLQAGDTLDIMGPLGNGFDLSFLQPDHVVWIVGGGIGVPPLYELSKQVLAKGAKPIHLLGFAKKELLFYEKEFLELGETFFATDDGSYGFHGHVGQLMETYKNLHQPDAIYACGANGLLKAVDSEFQQHPHAYLSLEARMACGMGACYACVCHLQGDQTQTKSKKVCDQGPVFSTGEVVL